MTTHESTRSLPELVSSLSQDVSTLFRKEVELAKAEAGEKAGQVLTGVGFAAAGGVLALAALAVLLSAIVAGLAALFVAWGMHEAVATALAALLIALVFGIVAFVLVKKGLDALKGTNLMLNRTADSLQRDVQVVKEKV